MVYWGQTYPKSLDKAFVIFSEVNPKIDIRLCLLVEPERRVKFDEGREKHFARKRINALFAFPFSGIAEILTFSSSFSQPTISLERDFGITLIERISPSLVSLSITIFHLQNLF